LIDRLPKIHKIIVAVVVLLFVGINVYLFSDQAAVHDIRIQTKLGTYDIKAEIAETFRQKKKGLMGRRRLEVGQGMLFTYNNPVIPAFWMKNMLIPLDLVFIGEDLVIKHIEEKAPPCLPDEECPLYRPPVPVQYVLEVPGGYTYLFKIGVGDVMQFVE
jgi:uncharacterized membrane protein (UPF0127 family)